MSDSDDTKVQKVEVNCVGPSSLIGVVLIVLLIIIVALLAFEMWRNRGRTTTTGTGTP